ncbi:hypothetical protein AOC10_10915 [Polynucleobacter asymbioticus]|nr:hypothetical protein AOC10_10915 [Polynucleobacter asymbioticus]
MKDINLLESAVRLQQSGQNAEARKIYLEVLEKLPHQEQALTNLGVLDAFVGDYQSACRRFKQVADLFPNKLSAWLNLASALEFCGNLDEASKSYAKALDLDGQNIQLLLRFGAFLKGQSKFIDAKKAYERVLSIEPKNLEALNNLGNTLRNIGELDAALIYLNRAVELHGGNEIIYNNIATIYSDLESQEKALDFYELALRSNPRHLLSWNGKGDLLRGLGKLEQAIDCFQSALDIDPDSLISQTNLAGAFIASNRGVDEKISQAKKALNVHLANAKNANSNTFAFFALKHHLDQANYLVRNKIFPEGVQNFISTADQLINSSRSQESFIHVDGIRYKLMSEYLGARVEYEIPNTIRYGLNPDNDWKKIEEEYFDSNETIYIDDFLSPDALEALYKYSLISKLWVREYSKCYLGAFGYQGFISKLHLQIADELKHYLPGVIKNYNLSHLWAFKYDTKLGAGINIHADPAKVNVNFWLTPDEFNLEKDRSGLIVYGKKAKEDWDFYAYNNNSDRIYDYLAEGHVEKICVPYKRNRCVLFNSVLFHETDKIGFSDQYEGRRINMTYLFGQK